MSAFPQLVVAPIDRRGPEHRRLERRLVLTAASALALAPLGVAVRAQSNIKRATPNQPLGPFYPRTAGEMPRETDADLVATDGARILAKGTPLYLAGRVVHRSGTPLAQALVEIWQCDAHAVYHHPAGDNEAARDPNFQGYGTARTDAEGYFHFRTIKPVSYPGRAPHIHMRVATSVGTLVTQWYLPNEPGNARDVMFRALGDTERAALTLKLREGMPTTHPLAWSTRLSAQVEVVVG